MAEKFDFNIIIIIIIIIIVITITIIIIIIIIIISDVLYVCKSSELTCYVLYCTRTSSF